MGRTKTEGGSDSGSGIQFGFPTCDIFTVLAFVLLTLHFVALTHCMNVALGNHFGGFGSSVIDGMDLLGFTDIWDLQPKVQESRWSMYLINWGFYPSAFLARLIFGDTWNALYFQLILSLLTVTAGGIVIFLVSWTFSRNTRTGLLLVLLYILMPATFGPALGWYGQPVFLQLLGSMYLLKRNRPVWAGVLVFWGVGCHPLTLPVFLSMAWSAFRVLPNPKAPFLPGFGEPDASARRKWKASLWISAAASTWIIAIVVTAYLLDRSGHNDVLWSFASGKPLLNEIGTRAVSGIYYALPVLAAGLAGSAWIPTIITIMMYLVLGSQGVVTGFSLPGTVLIIIAAAQKGTGLSPGDMNRRIVAAIVLALLMNLFVPFSRLFPLTSEPASGGLLAPSSWSVKAHEAAADDLVTKWIPEGTGRCLSSWQHGPIMASRCKRITAFSNPFRRNAYTLEDFLQHDDDSLIVTGYWDFILLDIFREESSGAVKTLLKQLASAGIWKEVGRTQDVILFKRIH